MTKKHLQILLEARQNHPWLRATGPDLPAAVHRMDGNQSPWRLRLHGPPSLRFLVPWALSGVLRASTFNSSSVGCGGLRPTEQPPGQQQPPWGALGRLLLLPSSWPSRPIANDAGTVRTPPCECLLPGHSLGLQLFGEHSFGYPLFLQQRRRETQGKLKPKRNESHFCL